MARYPWPVFLLLSFVVSSVRFASAQPAHDVQLSPPEPRDYALPASIAIQSSAHIATTTLAVWGTTRFAPSGERVNTLFMQLFADSLPIAPSVQLHSDAARPFDFVRVIPNGRWFTVIWNDGRSDMPGIYARNINIDGAFINPEQRISPGRVAVDTGLAFTVIGYPSGGRGIVWRDSREGSPGVYVMRIDALGNCGSEMRLGGIFTGLLQLDPYAAVEFVRTDERVAAIGPGGTIDTAHGFERLKLPFFMFGDSSIVTLDGSRLMRYSHLTDSAPDRIVDLDLPLLQLRSLQTISYGTDDLYHIYSVGVDDTLKPKAVHVVRSDFSNTFDLLRRDTLINGDHELIRRSVLRGRGNGYAVQMNFIYYYCWHCYGNPETRYDSILYSIDSVGMFHTKFDGFVPFVGTTPAPDVVRKPTDTLSIVEVNLGGLRRRVTAPNAFTQLNFPQRYPGLKSVGNDIYLTMQYRPWEGYNETSDWDLPKDSRGDIYRWEPGTGLAPMLVASGPIGQFRREPPGSYYSGYYNSWYVHWGGSGVDVFGSTFEMFGSQHVSERSIESAYFTYHGMYVSTPSGWITTNLYQSDSLEVPIRFVFESLCVDPRTDQVLEVYYMNRLSRHYLRRYVAAYDSVCGLLWKIELSGSQRGPVGVVPIDKKDFLLISADTVAHQIGNDTVATFLLSGGAGLSYQRLVRRDAFIRYGVVDGHLMLETYDFDCRLLHSRLLEVSQSLKTPLVVQNRDNGDIAILWGGDGGIYCTIVTEDLDVLDHGERLSSAGARALYPNGMFRGDTLVAVWEDYRNGEADVYGTVYPTGPLARPDLDVPVSADARFSVGNVFVDPFADRLAVGYVASQPTHVRSEIISLVGEVLVRQDADVVATDGGALSLDIAGLRSGTYLVRVNAPEGSAVRKILIVR